MVVSRDQGTQRARGFIDRLADLGVDQLNDRSDDVARRAELAEFTRPLDLLQEVASSIADQSSSPRRTGKRSSAAILTVFAL